MNKYAQVAINAVLSCKEKGISPVNAWETEIEKIFVKGSSSARKGCPKGAFLGLCESGLIKNIPSGVYTNSIKNKEYAIKAVNLIKNNRELSEDPKKLWDIINPDGKAHNSQMNIVCELYKAGFLMI